MDSALLKVTARLFALFACLLAMTSPTGAATVAEGLVKDSTERILAAIQGDRDALKQDPERLRRLVDEIVLPLFDFERMSMRVLGKEWRVASEAQRVKFTSAFRDLLVHTYSTALAEYTDETIQFLPSRTSPDGADATVRTEVVRRGGALPIPINYAMYRGDDRWKIYDVTINGVSLVINYRSTFASKIQKIGIDGLISELEQFNAKPGK